MDKATLRQYRAILREIAHLEEEKRRVLDGLLAPPSGDGTPRGSGEHDRIGSAVARRDKYQRMIDRKLDKLIALRREIESAVAALPPKDRYLIRLRYIDGLRWEDVAAELHYGYQWTLTLHGRILQRMEKKR